MSYLSHRLIGQEYCVTRAFCEQERHITLSVGDVVKVMDVINKDNSVIVHLAWPGAGVLVTIDDLALLVAVPPD